MAARKGKTSTRTVKSLKSKRLDASQAGQVKGGLLPAVNVALKYESPTFKWAPTNVAYKLG